MAMNTARTAGLLALPAELRDHIWEMGFRDERCKVHLIEIAHNIYPHKPGDAVPRIPSILQVCRQSLAETASMWYGTRSFTMRSIDHASDYAICVKWLQSIDEDTAKLIRRISISACF
jgi:hypothetical protein